MREKIRLGGKFRHFTVSFTSPSQRGISDDPPGGGKMNPLSDSVPAQILLTKAPLVSVVCQVKFPANSRVLEREFAEQFRLRLEADYPVLRQEGLQSMSFGPDGFQQKHELIWRYQDIDRHWRVSLGENFVSLEATKYQHRNDFIDRVRALLQAAEALIKPPVVDRIGVRYINRIVGDDLRLLPEFVRAEVLGLAGADFMDQTIQMSTQLVVDLRDPDIEAGRLVANIIIAPPFSSHEAILVPPLSERSWILDLDISRENAPDAAGWRFDVESIVSSAEAMAKRAYGFFRWAVTEKFIDHFGGQR
jgi:uncharacterized protein (TIGR04255 family)